MRASLKKALADHDLYLKKLGVDKIRKRRKTERAARVAKWEEAGLEEQSKMNSWT